MRVKFNGGPEHGKYHEIQDGYSEFLVEVMDPKNHPFYAQPFDLYAPAPFKRGSYRPANTVLKNGTRVWQWMGWYSN